MQKRAKIEAASPPTPLLLTFSAMSHTLCVLLTFFFRVADLSTCSRGSGATSKHGDMQWLEEEIRGVIPDCNVEAVDLNGI